MAATHTADFSVANAEAHEVGAQAVYTRNSWFDEWTLQPHLWANWVSRALSPGISTAELSWNYGYARRYDEAEFNWVAQDTGARRYVRVDHTNSFGLSSQWVGLVNGLGTQLGGKTLRPVLGVPFPVESGQQTIHCVGLKKLLYDTVIRTSAWRSVEDGNRYFIDRGLTFNAPKADGTPGANKSSVNIGAYPLFSGKVLDDDEHWNTWHILRYLLNYHNPSDKNGAPLRLTWNVAEMAPLADFAGGEGDRPIVPTHGRSVGDIFDQLFAHQRFWAWKLEGVVATNELQITVVPLTGDDITLSTGKVVSANLTRWSIDASSSAATASHVLSHAEAVDRVRFQGARATSTFTINKNSDATAEQGWNATQLARYTAGAQASDEYIAAAAAGNKELMKQLNEEARSRDEVRCVFSRIIIRNDWNGVAKDGQGAGGNLHTPTLSITEDAPTFKFNQRELHVLPTLPLKDGYDYSVGNNPGGSENGLAAGVIVPTKLTTGPFNNSPPLVFLKVPSSSPARYIQADRMGHGAEHIEVPGDPSRHFSLRVSVPRHDRAVVVDVTGRPQWMIGGSDFVKPAEDIIDSDKYDWKDAVITVAVEMDCFCEGRWPPLKAMLPNSDTIREVILPADDTFRLDWLVPNTVVGVKRAPGHVGELVKCTLGGWIADDRVKLAAMARLAFAWYGIERRAITLSSSKLVGNAATRILHGDFVVDLDDREVNSVVTEWRIDSPPGTLDSPPPPTRVTYVTDFISDLDLYLSPNLAKTAAKPAMVAAAKPATVAVAPAVAVADNGSMHRPFE